MNIALWKNRKLNLEDVAQKHARAVLVPSVRSLANGDIEFTAAFRQVRAPLKAEQGLLRQIPNMGAIRVGALIEQKRNTILLRSEDY